VLIVAPGSGDVTPSTSQILASVVAVVFFSVQGVIYRQSQGLGRIVRRVQEECAALRQLLVGINGDNGLHSDVRRMREDSDARSAALASERQEQAVWRRGVEATLREHQERLGMLERRRQVARRREDRRSRV
jgi:hypothetical protein